MRKYLTAILFVLCAVIGVTAQITKNAPTYYGRRTVAQGNPTSCATVGSYYTLADGANAGFDVKCVATGTPGTWTAITPGTAGGITGTLTSGAIPKATGANTLGNSSLTDDGTNLTTTDTTFRLGGATSSFPALKQNGQFLQIRLADDSGNATIATGGIRTSFVTVTSAYTVTPANHTICVNTSGGAVTVTLPAASTMFNSATGTSNEIVIKDCNGTSGTNAITVQAQTGEAIDAANTRTVNTNYAAVTLQSNGGTKYIVY